jgi:hypothetical protein
MKNSDSSSATVINSLNALLAASTASSCAPLGKLVSSSRNQSFQLARTSLTRPASAADASAAARVALSPVLGSARPDSRAERRACIARLHPCRCCPVPVPAGCGPPARPRRRGCDEPFHAERAAARAPRIGDVVGAVSRQADLDAGRPVRVDPCRRFGRGLVPTAHFAHERRRGIDRLEPFALKIAPPAGTGAAGTVRRTGGPSCACTRRFPSADALRPEQFAIMRARVRPADRRDARRLGSNSAGRHQVLVSALLQDVAGSGRSREAAASR